MRIIPSATWGPWVPLSPPSQRSAVGTLVEGHRRPLSGLQSPPPAPSIPPLGGLDIKIGDFGLARDQVQFDPLRAPTSAP